MVLVWSPDSLGRSLWSGTTHNDLLVVKLARIQDDPDAMHDEAGGSSISCHQRELAGALRRTATLAHGDHYLFRIVDPPGNSIMPHRPSEAMHSFYAHHDYFRLSMKALWGRK